MPAAKTEKIAPEIAPAADTVFLVCEKLGETRPFTPAHAKALLGLQAERGLSDWQPAPAPPAAE